MGIQRTIRFPEGTLPDWPAVAVKLTEIGEPTTLRMIDGMPAFPDEVPEPGWQELRVGLTGGMVTLRRAPDGFVCVAWGSADPALSRSWDHLCWAVAAAGNGILTDPSGERTAGEFLSTLG
jgi:hypothetical protein